MSPAVAEGEAGVSDANGSMAVAPERGDEGGEVAATERGSCRRVLGVGVDALEPNGAFEQITAWASARVSARVAFMPVHSLVTAARERRFAEALSRFALVLADGQPVRWMLNLRHRSGLAERVYGPTMMWRLCGWAAEQGCPVYLYGGKQEVLHTLVARLEQAFAGLRVVGAESPPFRALSDEEVTAARERINASGARLVFVGLGCPKQELLADRLGDEVRAVQLCVGAAFDFHAGAVSMAPAWMQRRGLEWLYRLMREPRRLWKRYLVTNTLFLVMAAGEMVRPRRGLA
ncbi:MAG: WecB/TagA/CpsF family glycosyltransferase [Planctomycetota bacterium]